MQEAKMGDSCNKLSSHIIQNGELQAKQETLIQSSMWRATKENMQANMGFHMHVHPHTCEHADTSACILHMHKHTPTHNHSHTEHENCFIACKLYSHIEPYVYKDAASLYFHILK